MGLLLDTQMLAWIGQDSPKLKPYVRSAIVAEDALFVSSVTAWEFADLNIRGRFGQHLILSELLEQLNAVVLGFPAEAWRLAEGLPQLHLDPVDRMLIGHAIHADLTVATSDRRIRDYPVRTLW